MVPESLPRLIRSLHTLAVQGAAGVTDAQLLERFVAAKDEAAFELLLWRHGPMVLGVCRRLLRHAHDAEDAFQATFLALARKGGSIGRREAVGGWLAKVAYRVALRMRIDVARRAVCEQSSLIAVAASERGWDDLGEVLDEEINRLPARQRAAFVLCYLEGKTGEEAARELGCAPGTVSSRLTRARERLRQALTRRGVAPDEALSSGDRLVVGVPAALFGRTLVGVVGAGEAMPARVVVYAEGVLRAMMLTRLKVLCICVMLAGVMALGGAMASQALDTPEVPKDKQAEAKAKVAPPLSRAVVKPQPGGLPQTLYKTSTFQPFQQQEVYATGSGTLMDVSVELGSRVKKGQLLARIDAPELVFAVKEAEIAVRLAKGEVEEAMAKLLIAEAEAGGAKEALGDAKAKRRQGIGPNPVAAQNDLLMKEGNVSRSKVALAIAKIKVEAPELALEKARHHLKQTQLRASFDGIVTHRDCREGEIVGPGAGRRGSRELMTVQRIDKVRTTIYVGRSWAPMVKPGMPAKVAFDPATETNPINCTVLGIGYVITSADTMTVEIDIPNPGEQIRPGMGGQITIDLPAQPGAVRVPTSCLSVNKRGQLEANVYGGYWAYVYVVRDGKAQRTRVLFGVHWGKEVEIHGGLKPTDVLLKEATNLQGEEITLEIKAKDEPK